MSSRYQPTSRPSLRTLELGQPRPRFPISPPETERNAPVHSLGGPTVATPDGDKEESPLRHLRRAPSVHYNNQTAPFARSQQTRSPRWLLVVLPPATCVEGEPALGHTLATGPPGRLQSGVLIPLFPTMYGQLAAIAKEFNFPSTAGVCLYLHVSEPGVNISPRISDDAWQLLWNPYFSDDGSAATTTPLGLPICGQVEFDVDVRKARWYESWLAGQEHRISLDESIPPSVAQTMSRWYQEHREVAQDTSESLLNDSMTMTSAAPVRSKPIPRPLTLSTRSDGLKSLAKYKLVGNSRETDTVDAAALAPKRAISRLSPVVQVDESASNQKDIDALVRNWRATTPMAPVIPRTGPAGESVPDTYDLPFSDIDMDDFQFSLSSAGPPSRWPTSAELDDPLYSVGLDRRMLGSVVLTPSVATSFGPDDSLVTPTFSNASRFPSPDIAARMVEDSPATPSTATSWGAPSMWPATPASIFRLNTPDIGRRAFGSTPPTPSTATSWGAPEFWPPSPVEEVRPPTPDIASRVHGDELHAYRFVWPFFGTNEARPYPLVWPFFNHEVNPAVPMSGAVVPTSQSEISPSPFLVWPYFTAHPSPLRDLHLSTVYPAISMNEAVYPNLVIYPPLHAADSAEIGLVQKLLEGKICPSYDYPNLVIYAETVDESRVGSNQKESYGFFNLYPAVYPSVVPYPARYECDIAEKTLPVATPTRPMEQATALSPLYPFFDLYPALYPSLVIYPVSRTTVQPKHVASNAGSSVHLTSSYPYLVLYTSEYPHLEIYPTVAASVREEDVQLAKKVIATSKEEPLSTLLQSCYPYFNLYPAPYPSLEIYPNCHQVSSRRATGTSPELGDLKLHSIYPYLDIYPSVYPHLEIYPTLLPPRRRQLQIKVLTPPEEVQRCITALPSFYPYLNIYPSIYPFLEIYPPAPLTPLERPITPAFCYPNIVIYESVHGSRTLVPDPRHELPLPVRLEPAYPIFNLYPAGYPHLEIYPNIATRSFELEPVLLPGAVCNYPTLCIYPVTQSSRHKKTPSISISIRMSEATIRSIGSPRQRTRRGSNQWALTSVSPPVAPRLRRGSVNASDARASAVPSTRKPATRPRVKPHKSHSDLIKEVLAHMSTIESNAREETKVLAPSVASGLRRVASARVDDIPHKDLHRSRTVPTSRPPVPRKAQVQPSPASIGGSPEDLLTIGTSVDAIVAAMNALDGSPVAERASRTEAPALLGRKVSKLDKNRYPSRIW